MSVCKSCGKAIRWIVLGNGKRMPLDPLPSPSGNIVLDPKGVGRYAAPGDVSSRYVTHFATCPNAARHRRRR
jgi:hypothetical protein